MPSITPFRALAVICAAQGLGLVAYAVYVVVASALTGTTGSSAVSNPGAMIVLAVTLGIFGAGLLLIWSWWSARQCLVISHGKTDVIRP